MTLADYLRVHGLTIAAFARRLGGLDAKTVQRYAAGQRIPAPEYMIRIYRVTDGSVRPDDFYHLPPLRRRGRRAA